MVMIKLRKMVKSDLPFLLEVRNHESTRKNLESDSIFSLEKCEEWFSTLISPWYIIENKEVPVGYFRTNGGEVGCDIHPDYRRNGYAREAYVQYLSNVDRASLWVFEDNFAKKLYEELDFSPSGEAKIVRGRNYLQMIWENKIQNS
jgi:RimJ/RimL family protein N-acetyltransferase